MKEQICAFTLDKELWWEGTRELIPRDGARGRAIKELFKDKDMITLIHTHPMHSCYLSQIDIDTLNGLLFTTGKIVSILLVSGIEHKKFIFVLRNGRIQHTEVSSGVISYREKELAVRAIEKSDYFEDNKPPYKLNFILEN